MDMKMFGEVDTTTNSGLKSPVAVTNLGSVVLSKEDVNQAFTGVRLAEFVQGHCFLDLFISHLTEFGLESGIDFLKGTAEGGEAAQHKNNLEGDAGSGSSLCRVLEIAAAQHNTTYRLWLGGYRTMKEKKRNRRLDGGFDGGRQGGRTTLSGNPATQPSAKLGEGTHIFPRTRELPQFPISPKPLFLSKNRLRNPPKPVLKQYTKLCTYAQKKSLHICKVFGKKKSFFRKFVFATGLIFERFLAPRSRFFEKWGTHAMRRRQVYSANGFVPENRATSNFFSKGPLVVSFLNDSIHAKKRGAAVTIQSAQIEVKFNQKYKTIKALV
ncbi:hypothetical protein LXL04_023400 [Taraxacum kok-saghyz]